MDKKQQQYLAQCKATGYKIEQKHLTKLNKYLRDPDGCIDRSVKTKYYIKPGTRIIKKYKGKEYIVTVISENKFMYKMDTYETLSSIAKLITGHKVSGYEFFGFYNKNMEN
ncbi:MAG TPA: DUF2924 domain-containing protein [Alphaproteobacteria bacterium]|nr:DUF2924 domain-containing protein [Alphaproteobacteria bacterium]